MRDIPFNRLWLSDPYSFRGHGCVIYLYQDILKSGKLSSRVYELRVPATHLNKCDLCGRLGVPKIVSDRGYYFWGRYKHWKHWHIRSCLCMGCSNKIRPMFELYDQLEALQKTANALKRGDYRPVPEMKARKTTADLREILFQTMERVAAGEIDPKEAREVSNLATRIIDSARLELDYSQTLSRLDRDGQDIATGPVLLTDQQN